jgi:hypothetical protein
MKMHGEVVRKKCILDTQTSHIAAYISIAEGSGEIVLNQ